jgi:hypothetical protein
LVNLVSILNVKLIDQAREFKQKEAQLKSTLQETMTQLEETKEILETFKKEQKEIEQFQANEIASLRELNEKFRSEIYYYQEQIADIYVTYKSEP